MQTPVYTRFEYVDATAFSKAASQLAMNTSALALAAEIDGLVRPDVMTTSHALLVMTVNLPAPFAVINGSGILAGAHGTNTGADTSTYTVDFSSLVPGSGSRTAYLIATLTTISQGPYQVVGPPLGHQSYVPGFIPFTAYDTTVDTIAVTASLSPADNVTTYELGRVTLTSSTTVLPALNTANQILAAPLPIENSVFVTGNKSLARADAGVNQIGDGGSPNFTMPDVLASQAELYTVTARASPVTVQVSTAGNLIFGATGDPATGVTSFVVPVGWSVTLVSDGTAWQVTSSSGTVGGVSVVNIAMTNADVTLTVAQASAKIINITGALTAAVQLLFPSSVNNIWAVRNATTGVFAITARNAALTGGTVQLNASTTQVMLVAGGMQIAGANFITQNPGNNTTLAASCAFVQNAIVSLSLVNSFNTRTGAVTLSSLDVTTALGFSPVQSFNTRTGVITLTSGDVTTALGYTPVNNGGGTVIGSADSVAINDVSGTIRRFAIQTAGTLRWRWGGTSAAEGGGNAGTDFFIQAFDDGGASLGNYLVFNRATGVGNFTVGPTFPTQALNDGSTSGATTFYADRVGTTTFAAAQSYVNTNFLPLTGGQLSGSLTVGDGSAGFAVNINGANSTFRDYRWSTNGNNRWIARTTATAEGGSNVGSDWSLIRVANNGTIIDTVLGFNRSTGVGTFGASPVLPTPASGDNSTNGATTAYVDSSPFGFNMIPHVVAHSFGVTLTNTTGRQKCVFVSAISTMAADNIEATLSGGPIGSPITVVSMGQTVHLSLMFIMFFVPPGSSYVLAMQLGGTASSIQWVEYF